LVGSRHYFLPRLVSETSAGLPTAVYRGRKRMAANFKISVRAKGDSLLLTLNGDFDGSSAHELLNTVSCNSKKVAKIIINTSGLNKIFEFGRNVFLRNLKSLQKHAQTIVITGSFKEELAPAGLIQAYR